MDTDNLSYREASGRPAGEPFILRVLDNRLAKDPIITDLTGSASSLQADGLLSIVFIQMFCRKANKVR